ncbi:response regulator transcription factor [Methylobacterium bullatum]|uniref:Response regulator protein TmoT n=1 Tax=Methylobacterium bullatum TaxID=570505 RepID=A0AAV4Z9W0_9HYPH|nr:response regulator transcription factor [Methylobacterium bullatum]MBD8903520.1 DNA-binding response regulator [Methylobacterium bullatum]GJD40894.1 Response regulator protein TmoT [Methylobacterium bullatum]
MIRGNAAGPARASAARQTVFVVDDDPDIREALSGLLRSIDLACAAFASVAEFLAAPRPLGAGCLVVDVRLPGVSGLEFQGQLSALGIDLPMILMTGHGDIPMTVKAMKAGAVDFLAKPFREQDLLDAIGTALARDAVQRSAHAALDDLKADYETLTAREREVMAQVTAGLMNKQVAGNLGLSEITVKIHRGHVMRKMKARSLADLVRSAEALGVSHAGGAPTR